MVKVFTVVTAALVLGVPAHAASVLFSNLVEPGGQYGFDDVGFGNTPGSQPENRNRGVAVRFSVGMDSAVSYFQVPLNVRSGTNLLNAYLLSDASGLPGSVVETYTLTNLPPGGPTLLSTVPSTTRPLLRRGEDYWFAVNTQELDTFAGWTLTLFEGNANQSADMALGGFIGDPLSGWIVGPGGPAAREGTLLVVGEAVPEPATLLTTAVPLFFLLRRKMRATSPRLASSGDRRYKSFSSVATTCTGVRDHGSQISLSCIHRCRKQRSVLRCNLLVRS